MRVLSLFSGIGGLDLGLERAGMEVVAQCEVDPYCCRILAKHWPHVPNFGDVTTIDWSTVPDVDLICGGYPCQPFSLAGRRQGADDVRHLWPYVLDAVRHLRPSWVLLENVPGHLSLGFGRVLGDLAESGYDAEWDCIPAAAVGAHHRRDRVFIVAYPQRDELRVEPVAVGRGGGATVAGDDGPAQHVADPNGAGLAIGHRADAGEAPRCWTSTRPPRSPWWEVEPDVGRVVDGVPSRVDRLRGLGNAVVPQVAEHVGRLIMEAAS